jgi:hypothetical protein
MPHIYFRHAWTPLCLDAVSDLIGNDADIIKSSQNAFLQMRLNDDLKRQDASPNG